MLVLKLEEEAVMSPLPKPPSLFGIELFFHVKKVSQGQPAQFGLGTVDLLQGEIDFRRFVRHPVDRFYQYLLGGDKVDGQAVAFAFKFSLERREAVVRFGTEIEVLVHPSMQIAFFWNGRGRDRTGWR